MKYAVFAMAPDVHWLAAFDLESEARQFMHDNAESTGQDYMAIIPVLSLELTDHLTDRHALQVTQIAVDINGPRTPYNLESAVHSLLQELSGMQGEDNVHDFLTNIRRALEVKQQRQPA